MKKALKKILVGLAIAAASTVALTGCSSEVSTKTLTTGIEIGNSYGEGAVTIVEIPDGDRKVKCAVLVGYSKGGISCDWANAKTKEGN